MAIFTLDGPVHLYPRRKNDGGGRTENVGDDFTEPDIHLYAREERFHSSGQFLPGMCYAVGWKKWL